MLSNRLKEYRERAGLTQTELAWRARVASQNISAIERGTLAPWPRIKKAISAVLKVPESELFPEACEDGKTES